MPVMHAHHAPNQNANGVATHNSFRQDHKDAFRFAVTKQDTFAPCNPCVNDTAGSGGIHQNRKADPVSSK